MTPTLEHLALTTDAAYWPAVADAVLAFARAQGLPQRNLSGLQVVLTQGSHAMALRSALHARAGGALLPPRVRLWGELAAGVGSSVIHRMQLFEALRTNAWVRDHFGAQPQALWALAQQLEGLADELSYAAAARSDLSTASIEAALQRHYRQRAARSLLPQARLALELWRAGGDARASGRLAQLNALAEAATQPLVFLSGLQLEPWIRVWLERYAQRAPVLCIEPDVQAVVRATPWLAAAWPELMGEQECAPIADRADVLRGAARPPLTILRVHSLEEEASAVAQQVLDALARGASSVALVALDRLTARRARALLERAQVLVRDEAGWKLSTTNAAAVLMRWFDLVLDDFYWRDVLDWLKSTFTLAGRPHKAQEVAFIEQAIRASGALQGARALHAAVHSAACPDEQSHVRAGALEVLSQLQTHRHAAMHSAAALGVHVSALSSALDALGMRTALQADAVGRAVLQQIEALTLSVEANAATHAATPRLSTLEWRSLLAQCFEQAAFVDEAVHSPVVMVSLEATVLRAFEVAVLIGADASHLPSAHESTLFMANPVRAELGLTTRETARRLEAQQLALLLRHAPQVVATWRVHRNGEPNALSPWLERLRFVLRQARAMDLCAEPQRAAMLVQGVPQSRPAPRAGVLLPRQVSASAAQSLVHCPYQFYARRLLGLREQEDLIEMPDKRDFGDALHEVLRRFHAHWGEAAFHEHTPIDVAASLRQHARAVFEPQLARTPALLAFARRFEGLIPGYVAWLQQQCREGWRWRAGELKRSRIAVLRDGTQVELTGRIDRVDVHQDGQVQLIDYKARAATALQQGLKQPGEDVQLPFYGALLEPPAQGAQYLSFDRAKEDESGVQSVPPKQPFAPLTAAVLQRLHNDLQRVREDAPLPAIGADSVCEVCEMRGLCRRDYWEGTEVPSHE